MTGSCQDRDLQYCMLCRCWSNERLEHSAASIIIKKVLTPLSYAYPTVSCQLMSTLDQDSAYASFTSATHVDLSTLIAIVTLNVKQC